MRIKKRLANITYALNQAGQGDFTEVLKDQTTDELRDVSESFNEMTKNIKVLVEEVADTSTQVQTASQHLLENAKETAAATSNVTASVTDIAENVSQQQEMMAQSALAINETTASIAQISENAANVADVSYQSIHKARAGQQSVENVVQQMSKIYSSNVETNAVILDLKERSVEIGKIVGAITDISDQTNLLALNAAIESARAGEHGKGFAVVAGEVRKLSEQSAKSAQLISTIVGAIQQDTVKVAQLMEQTHGEVETGIHVVKNTGETFHEIVVAIEVANGGIQELSAISEEMTASMQEINASIETVAYLAKTTATDTTQIFSATEEQLALTEQVMRASETLTKESNELQNILTRFKV